jgi:anti-sigma factor ChrR (cupin superfamily)
MTRPLQPPLSAEAGAKATATSIGHASGQAQHVLSSAWVGAIAQGLAVADTALSPASAQAIKTRLMQRIAAHEEAPALKEDTLVTILRNDAWVHLGKRVQVKVLHDDGTTLSWLLKLLPGGRLPEHDHSDGTEECMILEGQLRINGTELVCGDYQIAHPGSVHYEVASEHGALVFLKSPSSRRSSLVPG